MFMINYINYIPHVHTHQITKFVAYLLCMCTVNSILLTEIPTYNQSTRKQSKK